LSRRIKVASVERVGPFQKSIHVLLRHRPRIISPRSPLHAKHDYCFSSKAALPAVAPVSPAPCVRAILRSRKSDDQSVDSQGVVPGSRMASSWPFSPFELSGSSDGPGWGLGVA